MKKSNLGLCCQYMDDGENILKVSGLQLGRYNKKLYDEDRIVDTYTGNVHNLLNNLDRVFSEGFTLFRFPSGIFPLFDKVPEELWNNDQVIGLLKKLGELTRKHNVRATFHPGQYCSLSSDDDDVIRNSVSEINHHAWIFDMMGLDVSPYYAINVHGGKGDREDNLIKGISWLSESARGRLTLENCETAYSVADLYTVHKRTDVPIVWDSHHHSFNDGGLTDEQAMRIAIDSWGDIKPLQHISNSRNKTGTFQKRRAHSDYITEFPKCQLKVLLADEVQVDIEAKMKNHAIDRLMGLYKG